MMRERRSSRVHLVGAAALAGLLAAAGTVGRGGRVEAQAAPYFPERFDWERVRPEQAGMDPARLADLAAFAQANENPGFKDLRLSLATSFGAREPFDHAIGPVRERGSASGLVLRGGRIVAEWGDTRRVDMTFSVAKSFLSTVVGIAWQKGLIRDVNDLVRDYMPNSGHFDGPHNSRIAWDHLLRQTSDWQGTLWGKPDWADRPEGERPSDWPNRPLHEPGTRYKYNDTRVNLLALAALHVWRRPLPQVLRAEVMDPIGASSTWEWHGYENSWVELDGQRMQSVSGGGHYGGGLFISAHDMARFGYLFLRQGRWKDRQIVSEKWIAMARTPGVNREYGFMNWFLNTDRKPLPAAPATAVTFRGNGQNIIYIDWEHDLVAVFRWISTDEALREAVAKLVGSLTASSSAR
jgi:CubicO group peptidase (beta-lactamase class C family)